MTLKIKTNEEKNMLTTKLKSGLSKYLPGLRIASSRRSFLFVIPITKILFKASTPSIMERSWLTILS